MKIFAIGDLHLSFDNRIQKPMDVFGQSWEDHEVRLKENWLKKVEDEDIVIIPGDISWGLKLEEALEDLKWISALPGTKVFVRGNHDLWWQSVGKINKLYPNMVFLQNNCYMAGDLAIAGSRGWVCPGSEDFDEQDEKIYKRELLRLEMSLKEAKDKGAKDIICALHYPPTNDKKQPSGFTKLMEDYGVKTCIYGHLHGKDGFKNGLKKVLNGVEYSLVSLDYLDCDPVEIRRDI
ncbi:MAG: metallophosphoesterase [Clostridia bacterium]|nr:metallophosphoesterase [Clostridia bacterium]